MNPPHFVAYNNFMPFPVNSPLFFTIVPQTYNTMTYSMPMSSIYPAHFENHIQPANDSPLRDEENIPKHRV